MGPWEKHERALMQAVAAGKAHHPQCPHRVTRTGPRSKVPRSNVSPNANMDRHLDAFFRTRSGTKNTH